jgi:hypothetical protein
MKHQPKLNPDLHYKFNIVNVMRLRDHLIWIGKKESKPEVGFNMGYYYTNRAFPRPDGSNHYCDTVACLAGHAALLCQNGSRGKSDLSEVARKWLGLTEYETSYLFSGSFSLKNLEDITLQDTIAELDFMIQNGHTSG